MVADRDHHDDNRAINVAITTTTIAIIVTPCHSTSALQRPTCPQSAMRTGRLVRPLLDPVPSMRFATDMPSTTLPKTTEVRRLRGATVQQHGERGSIGRQIGRPTVGELTRAPVLPSCHACAMTALFIRYYTWRAANQCQPAAPLPFRWRCMLRYHGVAALFSCIDNCGRMCKAVWMLTMLPIKPGAWGEAQEELRAVGVRPSVRH